MSNYYLKLRFNVLNDPIIATLPDNLWRRYFELYMSAKYVNNCGSFQPIDELTFHLRDDRALIENEIEELRALGLIHPTKNMIARYKDEQDAFTDQERKEQERERAHDASHKTVTKRDGASHKTVTKPAYSKKVVNSSSKELKKELKSSRSRKTNSAAATSLFIKAGISKEVASELSNLEHVTPSYASAIIWTWRKKRNPVTGLLVKMIRDGDTPSYSDYANRPREENESSSDFSKRIMKGFTK